MPSTLSTKVGIGLAAAMMACSSEITQPVGAPQLTIVVIEEERMIPDVDFDEADKDKTNGICVKDTPSGTLVLKDANEQTPSQLCPPPFLFKGKAEPVKIGKEWFLEDENRNGVVCAKETGAGRFIVKDDNTETPSQPCPPAFITAGATKDTRPDIPAKLLAEADDNDNGMVCVRIMENSANWVVKDDDLNLPSQLCPPSYSLEFVGKKVPPKV
jgi:hypothetical protein